MKKLLVLALVALMASGALAQGEQDEFGLWTVDGDGGYVNSVFVEQYVPFSLYITLHNASVSSVGGYEVGWTTPTFTIQSIDYYGGQNFGDDLGNHLVGYPTPQPVDGEIFVLCSMDLLSLTPFGEEFQSMMMAADPPSIPGHNGPVYANGANPDDLIPCGFITGGPHVFTFNGEGPTAVENHSWTGVKALFD
jgi:hypothetical protein